MMILSRQPWRHASLAMLTAALAALCSCRGPQSGTSPASSLPGGNPGLAMAADSAPAAAQPATPPSPAAGVPGQPLPAEPRVYGSPVPCMPAMPGTCPPGGLPMGPPGMEMGVPVPYTPAGPWAPPGIQRPWPTDEYLRDGGVAGPGVTVAPDWSVRGLGVEDAVAHYDTIDGRTIVEPTNPVYIYAPRFSAVRQVTNLLVSEQWTSSVGMAQPINAVNLAEAERTMASKQDLQANRAVGAKALVAARSRQFSGAMSSQLGPRTFLNSYAPYENVSVIRTGQVVEAEMAVLARNAQAAVTWSKEEAVAVLLDQKAAVAEVGVQHALAVYTVDTPNHPKLRVVKVASTSFAKPGELVAFTIRYDNVGDQVIGNVTIVDSLSTRLEYVPDTAQSSLQANFSTRTNEAGSLQLRWEITPPLQPGRGGVVRFTARVL